MDKLQQRKKSLFSAIFLRCAPLIWKVLHFRGRLYENQYWERYLQRQDVFKDKGVVFLGDSQVAQWSMRRYFGCLPIRNRGENGDCADAAVTRLYRDVITLEPSAVVILLGTNDIAHGRDEQEIAKDITTMVKECRAAKIEPFLCSVFPVRDEYVALRPPDRLKNLNTLIRDIAFRSRARYIDFWSSLVDQDGELRQELTYDGLHLNARGYGIITSVVKNELLGLLKTSVPVTKRYIGIIATVSAQHGGMYQYTQYLIGALLRYAGEFNFLILKGNNFTLPQECTGEHVHIKEVRDPSWLMKLVLFMRVLLRRYLGPRRHFLTAKAEVGLWINPVIPDLSFCYMDGPFVMFLYDFQHKYYPEFISIKEKFSMDFIFRNLARQALLVACGSEFVKRDILKFFQIEEDKIRITLPPPPVTLKNIEITPQIMEKVKDAYQLPEKFIFYPAHLWYHKNHIRLVEALRHIQEKYRVKVNLVLVGLRKNNFNNIMKKIREVGLRSQVRWLGYVCDEHKVCMYKLAIALVVPSLFESMCLPIGEAFYFGLPVACSNVCGLPEQLGEAALFFNPLDIEDMAEKILTVWTREDTRKTLVERGYAKAKEMTPEVFSQRWREVIEEALARMQEDGRWL